MSDYHGEMCAACCERVGHTRPVCPDPCDEVLEDNAREMHEQDVTTEYAWTEVKRVQGEGLVVMTCPHTALSGHTGA